MLKRLLSVRIVRWELKLAYIAGAWVLGWLVVRLPGAFGVPGSVTSTVSGVLDIGAILLGARIFRGKYEPIEPARAWWRMTAWPKLSRRLGIVFSVLAVLVAVQAGLTMFGAIPNSVGMTPYEFFVNVVYGFVIAFLYANSAVRLRRAGIVRPEPEPEVKLSRAPKLD